MKSSGYITSYLHVYSDTNRIDHKYIQNIIRELSVVACALADAPTYHIANIGE